MDWRKFSAVAKFANVRKAYDIVALAEQLNDFTFITSAAEEDIGHYFVDHMDGYGMNLKMEDFFDSFSFGEYFFCNCTLWKRK